ncbi:MAG TPA: AMP-binding protein [Alphaproteobacteria bacterium]
MTETFRSPREYVRRAAELGANRVALRSGGRATTYGELAAQSAALAASLLDAGVGPGVLVAHAFPNSVAFAVWYCAIWEAGGIVVPLAPPPFAPETARLIADSDAAFLALPDGVSVPRGVDALPTSVAGWHGALFRVAGAAAPIDTRPSTEDGYAVRHFSSGSTGRAKHMFKSEANLAFSLRILREAAALDETEVFLGALPFHTPYGVRALHAAFDLGAAVTILPRFLPGSALSAARRDRTTVFLASPAMIDSLAGCRIEDGDEAAFRTLKLCISSGAMLRREACEAFRARFGVPVRTWYATSETMGIAIDFEDGFEDGRVGTLMPGVEVGIFDAAGAPLPAGAVGQIAIRSDGCSRSYVNDSVASAKVFRDGRVFPGDRGYLDSSGRLFVVGRDDVINVGGYKVDPLEVERVVREALPVGEVIVLAGTRADLPTVKVVVEADPARVTPAMVVAACRARLSPYKVPAEVEVRARIERTASGKIVRTSLDGR